QYAERDRDHHCHPDRRERQLQVRDRLLADQAEIVEEEADGVDEGVHQASRMRRRLHGVTARWNITSSTSATIASATASTAAATNSGLKPVWIASKSGCPSPPAPMYAATVARLIVVTVAILTPAMIAGTASGISTRVSVWRGVSPIA